MHVLSFTLQVSEGEASVTESVRVYAVMLISDLEVPEWLPE